MCVICESPATVRNSHSDMCVICESPATVRNSHSDMCVICESPATVRNSHSGMCVALCHQPQSSCWQVGIFCTWSTGTWFGLSTRKRPTRINWIETHERLKRKAKLIWQYKTYAIFSWSAHFPGNKTTVRQQLKRWRMKMCFSGLLIAFI